MRKEALIGLSVLLVVVSGSATVLDSFGVISGEASVEPAVQITEVDYDAASGAEYVEFYNPSEGDADLSGWIVEDDSGNDSISSLTVPSKGYALLVDEDGDTSSLNVNFEETSAIGDGQLKDSGEFVKIYSGSDIEINSIDFSDDPCDSDQTLSIDWESESSSCGNHKYNLTGGSNE